MTNERFIGRCRLTDGEVRLVFEDERGQFVLDDDEKPVYGTWINREEEAADAALMVLYTSTFV
jgi:hypothetical protein